MISLTKWHPTAQQLSEANIESYKSHQVEDGMDRGVCSPVSHHKSSSQRDVACHMQDTSLLTICVSPGSPTGEGWHVRPPPFV